MVPRSLLLHAISFTPRHFQKASRQQELSTVVVSLDTSTIMRKFARKKTTLASPSDGCKQAMTTTAANVKNSQPEMVPAKTATTTTTTTAPSETRIADDLTCPITLELPYIPVTAQDGHVYEQSAIQKHFQTRRAQNLPLTSPMTNQRMGDRLLPAPRVKNLIETLIREHVLTGELVTSWKKTAKQHKDKAAWLALAQKGNVEAMSTVGYHYLWGYGAFEHDSPLGFAWTQKAHEAGDVIATGRMGYYLVAGCGVKRCQKLGLTYLGIAAGQGFDLSAYFLGIGFAEGRYGLDVNEKEAIRWLERCLDPSSFFKRLNQVCKQNARQKLQELKKPPPLEAAK
eukprot:scaffold1019_cov172-Amphora_coffeaeformis.AAC.18